MLVFLNVDMHSMYIDVQNKVSQSNKNLHCSVLVKFTCTKNFYIPNQEQIEGL